MNGTMEDLGIEVPELNFIGGLAGFPEARRFVLSKWGGDDSPFSLMQSLEDPELAFLVVPPAVFFPDYQPEIDDETAARLNISDSDDALILVMITVGEAVKEATANLLGPLVINRHSNEASQVILTESGYDLRTPVLHLS